MKAVKLGIAVFEKIMELEGEDDAPTPGELLWVNPAAHERLVELHKETLLENIELNERAKKAEAAYEEQSVRCVKLHQEIAELEKRIACVRGSDLKKAKETLHNFFQPAVHPETDWAQPGWQVYAIVREIKHGQVYYLWPGGPLMPPLDDQTIDSCALSIFREKWRPVREEWTREDECASCRAHSFLVRASRREMHEGHRITAPILAQEARTDAAVERTDLPVRRVHPTE